MLTNIIEFDAIAVRTSIEIVDKVQLDELSVPTPCADWNLGQLLAHMTTQHRGFAAAARGHGQDEGVWEVRPLGPDPVAEYRAAGEDVLACFGEEGVLEREFRLPEISADQPFAGLLAACFHTVDYVVHAWDVARAIGVEVSFDAEVLRGVGMIVAQIPNGPERLEPGAAFGPAIASAEDADPLAAVLAALGRSPQWPKQD